MIGNDIISLKHVTILTGDRKKRYYQKVFNDSEIALIQKKHFHFIESLFWAYKESAYKGYFRLHQKKIVSPKKIIVSNYQPFNNTAEIITPAGTFNASAIVTSQYVHATACLQNEGQYFTMGVTKNQDIAEAIALKKNKHPNEIRITKSAENIPTLWINNQPCALSLSHDYDWAAYCFVENKQHT